MKAEIFPNRSQFLELAEKQTGFKGFSKGETLAQDYSVAQHIIELQSNYYTAIQAELTKENVPKIFKCRIINSGQFVLSQTLLTYYNDEKEWAFDGVKKYMKGDEEWGETVHPTTIASLLFHVWEFNRELEKVEQPEPIEYSQRVADYNDAQSKLIKLEFTQDWVEQNVLKV